MSEKKGVSKGAVAVAGALVAAVGVGVPLAAQATGERSAPDDVAQGAPEATRAAVPAPAPALVSTAAAPDAVERPVLVVVPPSAEVCAQLLAQPGVVAPSEDICDWWSQNVRAEERSVTTAPARQAAPVSTRAPAAPVAQPAPEAAEEPVGVDVALETVAFEAVSSVMVADGSGAESVVDSAAAVPDEDLAYLAGYSDGYHVGATDGYVQGAYDGYYLGTLDAHLNASGSEAQSTLTVNGKTLDLVGVDPDNLPDLSPLPVAGGLSQPVVEVTADQTGPVAETPAVLEATPADPKAALDAWMAAQGLADEGAVMAAWGEATGNPTAFLMRGPVSVEDGLPMTYHLAKGQAMEWAATQATAWAAAHEAAVAELSVAMGGEAEEQAPEVPQITEFQAVLLAWMAHKDVHDLATGAQSLVEAWMAAQGVQDVVAAWQADQGIQDVHAAWVASGSVEDATEWAKAQLAQWIETQVVAWAKPSTTVSAPESRWVFLGTGASNPPPAFAQPGSLEWYLWEEESRRMASVHYYYDPVTGEIHIVILEGPKPEYHINLGSKDATFWLGSLLDPLGLNDKNTIPIFTSFVGNFVMEIADPFGLVGGSGHLGSVPGNMVSSFGGLFGSIGKDIGSIGKSIGKLFKW
ncbi:MAG: hypothetical protein FWD18_01335 [Micrococcales bacterium]|nr:hypothetical protein [Micrococcales bacterium]